MNIFFGKISQKFDTVQLDEGYYSAPKGSTWFGELEIGDYVYMIGGDKVQFWKAKEWGNKNGRESLFFDVLNADLGINVSQLIAVKFLKITKGLAVMTSRSARNKAFFKLELIKDISLEDLYSDLFYKNAELYRSIRIIKREDLIDKSEDIQLIYDNNKLQLADNDFIDNSIKKEFVDNLDKKGKGAKMKDTVLEVFSNAVTDLPTTFTYKQIGLRRFYDTFFCEYKENDKYYLVGAFWKGHNPEDMTSTFLKESIWENGFETELIDEVNKVPEGSHVAIKASYVRAKTTSVMMIKARGMVQKNLQDGHILEIEWEEDFEPFEVAIGSYIRDTIKEVTNKSHIQSIWNENGQMPIDKSDTKENNPLKEFYIPKNQILFGPPGTGKTFSSITRALSIIENNNESILKEELRSVVKERFDKLLKKERIHFSTFHQSLSYEDFIEGIKPKTKGTDVIYEIEDGIFKKIADHARVNWLQSKNSNNNFELLFELLKKDWQENEKSELRIPMKSSYFDIVDIREKNIDFRKSSGGTGHDLVISTLKDIYLGNRVMESGLAVYYYPLVEKLKTYKTNTSNVKLENYVLIIDEINRGNVSQIFGELITLIEDDKRLGKDEALEVILPYSKEKFGVPPNLYIVGTMNTADKSVEALDAALRRRFCFEEMQPLYNLEGLQNNIFEYKAFEILKTINTRIEKLIDKDHAIGHSYLLNKNKDSIVDTFYKNIIPLLQEYFFGDYAKIGLVLGKGFVNLKESDKGSNIFADFDDAGDDFDNRNVYEIIDYRKVTDYQLKLGKVEVEMNFEKAIQVLMHYKFD
jgi:hypothetical protein